MSNSQVFSNATNNISFIYIYIYSGSFFIYVGSITKSNP